MAWEKDLFTIPGAQAAADYSTTSKQFYCMKKDTTANRFVLCTVDGEIFIGVLQNKPNAAGKAAEIRAMGVTKVVADETLTAGDFWGTSVDGQAKIVESTNTGADTGDYVAGQVLVGAAAGELAIVTIGFPTFKVESA